jgi:hypothetical protein
LKADELQVGQRYEYVEKKREYYYVIIFHLKFYMEKEEDK